MSSPETQSLYRSACIPTPYVDAGRVADPEIAFLAYQFRSLSCPDSMSRDTYFHTVTDEGLEIDIAQATLVMQEEWSRRIRAVVPGERSEWGRPQGIDAEDNEVPCSQESARFSWSVGVNELLSSNKDGLPVSISPHRYDGHPVDISFQGFLGAVEDSDRERWMEACMHWNPLHDEHRIIVKLRGVERYLSIVERRMRDSAGAVVGIIGNAWEATNNLGLMKQAKTDELTGLANRWGYFERYTDLQNGLHALQQSETHKDLGIFTIMMDLNFYKEINDTFGHPMGDEILVLVAKKVFASFRSETKDGMPPDIICRFGGDELVISGISNRADIQSLVERIQKEMAHIVHIKNIGRDIFQSVSIGVSFSNDADKPVSEMIHEADQRMYRAKGYSKAYWAAIHEKFPKDTPYTDPAYPSFAVVPEGVLSPSEKHEAAFQIYEVGECILHTDTHEALIPEDVTHYITSIVQKKKRKKNLSA